MSKAVRFARYGDIDVLEVREVERPHAGPGEVLVEVKAAGINPGFSVGDEVIGFTEKRSSHADFVVPAENLTGKPSAFPGTWRAACMWQGPPPMPPCAPWT